MKRINTEEVRRCLDSGTAPVFDVRGDVDFERGHIPGAKTAPLGSLVFRVARVMNSAGGECGLASDAAERLENLGLRNVHVYHDGLQGWEAAGLPVTPSVKARIHAQGPVIECRPVVVDRERAYGGAFRDQTLDTEGAGG
jgi:rhodanese-related sulfurtransferase